METLTLNDGTVLEESSAIEDEDARTLFIYTRNNYGLKDVFDMMYDPEKTESIIYTYNNGEQVTYSGYTRLIAVRDEGRSVITAVLKKE